MHFDSILSLVCLALRSSPLPPTAHCPTQFIGALPPVELVLRYITYFIGILVFYTSYDSLVVMTKSPITPTRRYLTNG